MTAEERASKLVPRTFAGEPCTLSLVHAAATALAMRVQLAADCMSYHETHETALPERARQEEKTLQDLLTRELDERCAVTANRDDREPHTSHRSHLTPPRPAAAPLTPPLTAALPSAA